MSFVRLILAKLNLSQINYVKRRCNLVEQASGAIQFASWELDIENYLKMVQ
jgi:hypothetical protein